MGKLETIAEMLKIERRLNEAQSIVDIAELEIKHAALVDEYRGLPSVTLSGQSTDPQLN
jgi:hypothetical protein